ncbi:hypothetical protein [Bacillus cereus]|uniref:hypothetical protein n=1 Tax=Bacillus cereus TaxID=1396 RepID=UPI0039C2A599
MRKLKRILQIKKEFIENTLKENGIITLRFTFEGKGCCDQSYRINLKAVNQKAKEIHSLILSQK